MTTLHARRLAAASALALFAASPALAQDGHAGHGAHHETPAAPAPEPPADPHAGHGEPAPTTAAPPPAHHVGHAMHSPLGPYEMTRDASGTSWQPQAGPPMADHQMVGDWTVMAHALLNGVYSNQGGPRGGDKAFIAGMVMGMAQRQAGPGTLALRGMVSPDPFMGKSGYPLLLAAGETADGKTPLVDRQHPHDLFVELSASYSLPLGEDSSVFLYGGLPGEPAFGPPTFMHRASGMDSPEAPISHHWFDSTHITFGVLTAGYVKGRFKAEVSRFRGREPDEKRFDIETGELDSTAVRLSFNPTDQWALQTSWADVKSPEALDPHHDETRASISAMYVRRFGDEGVWATTAALARKDVTPGDVLWAGLLETAVMPNDRWTLFARAEQVDNNELTGSHGEAFTVGRLSAGAIRDFRLAPRIKVGVGALVSTFDLPGELKDAYDDPAAGMAFVRLKIG